MYGYGILNNHVPTLKATAMRGGSSSGDADALAFITNAGITDTTQKSAINTLVTDLKNYGIWTKTKAIYPFVGGTASQHRFNLKSPGTSASDFYLTFFGGGTHTSNGYVMNGVDSYANTSFNPSLISGWKDNHNLSIYLKTETPIGDGWHLGYGFTTTGNPLYGLAIRRNTTNALIYDSGNFTQNGRLQLTITDAKGLWSANALASNDRRVYKNGTSFGESFSTVSGTLPDDVMTIGAINGTGGALKYYLSGINSFTSFSDNMSSIEVANFNTAVTSFQTTLGRQN